jgi:hypothetical protein
MQLSILQEQPGLKAAAGEMSIALDQTRSSERREIRRTSRGTIEDRIAAGKLLDEKDMKEFADRAYAKCAAILRSAREISEPGSMFRHRRYGEKLLSKWCMNLLSFLLMEGGGQRPQVYRQLIVPEPAEIAEWNTKEVSLRTSLEKTPRSHECPAVLFPKRTGKLIRFHVQHVRPFIVQVHGNVEDHLSEVPLLLNTRTGDMLSSDDIRGTLRSFLTAYDPELSAITPMVLRSSFASSMFARYKRREVGQGKSSEVFLSDLAKLMNTSTEMLSATYMASNPHDFQASVLMLFKAFQGADVLEEEL